MPKLSERNKKAVFFTVWYFVLWGICTWAILEYFFPHSNYSNETAYTLETGLSIVLLLATGGLLLFYIRKRESRVKSALTVVLLASTVLLAVFLTPNATASAENKSKIQLYIEDLESQGFNVEYSAYEPFHKFGGHIMLPSYEDLTDTARVIEASLFHIHGGGPTYFMFFFDSGVKIWMYGEGYGYYLFIEP